MVLERGIRSCATLGRPLPPWASAFRSDKWDCWTRSRPNGLIQGMKDPWKSREEFCVHDYLFKVWRHGLNFQSSLRPPKKYSKSFLPACSVPWNTPRTHPAYLCIDYSQKNPNFYNTLCLEGKFWVSLKQFSLNLLNCLCFLWFVITPPTTASLCTLKIQTQPSLALTSLRPSIAELHSCDFINVPSKSDSETFY